MIRIASLLAVVITAITFIDHQGRADEIADARRSFVSGMKHFDLGELNAALSDFKDGYRAKEDPVFLYNIAQCYRLMHENQDAVRYYRLYISRSPDAPNRTEVERRIAALEAAIAADIPAKTTVPAAATTPPRALVSDVSAGSTPTNLRKPVYRRWWVWTIVGVAVAGAAVGVGVGVTRGPATTGSNFPTVGF